MFYSHGTYQIWHRPRTLRTQVITSSFSLQIQIMIRASILLLIGALFTVFIIAVEPKPVQVKTAIQVTDIGNSVTLIGRLGVPLGHKMTLQGVWSYPRTTVKDFSPRFTILTVNGKPLNQPVVLNIAQIRVMTHDHLDALPERANWRGLEGQRWSMMAYETGHIGLVPDEYNETSPVFPVVGLPYYTRPFTSELIAVVTHINERASR